MKIETGSIGLNIAMTLYGSQSILSYGDYFYPGTVEIPDEDHQTFLELVKEKREKKKRN